MNSESKSSTLLSTAARVGLTTSKDQRWRLSVTDNFSPSAATRLAFERALIVIRLVRLDTNQPPRTLCILGVQYLSNVERIWFGT
jgi:hypothetical protein